MSRIKKTFYIFSFLFCSFSLFSQASFGLRAGLTFPNQEYEFGSTNVDYDAHMGILLAAMLELSISEKFVIQPEPTFMQKGTKQDETFFGGTDESKVRLNYIDLPVLAKYKFGNEGVRAFVAAGPSLGYAISGSSTINGEREKFEEEEWEGFRRTNLGAVFAGGIGLGMPSGGTVFLDLRYFFDLSDFVDEDTDGNFFEGDVKGRNKGIALSIGYMF